MVPVDVWVYKDDWSQAAYEEKRFRVTHAQHGDAVMVFAIMFAAGCLGVPLIFFVMSPARTP